MADQTETDRLLNTRSDPCVRLYKYRWFILALHSLTALSSTMLWLSFISVSDATAECVDEIVIGSYAISFLQVVFALPMAFVPARFGLRKTMIAVGTFNAITAILTILSPTWSGFYSYLSGQFIASISNSILPHLAPKMSAAWFGKQEQSTSISIGIIMGSLGADIAFLRSVKRMFDLDDDFMLLVGGSKLKDLVYIQVAVCAVVLVLILFMYKERPPLPPSADEARRRKPGYVSFSEFYKCVNKLSRNANFLRVGNALALANALLVVVPSALDGVLMESMMLRREPASLVGYFGTATGFIGCLCFGKFFAKTEAHTVLAVGLSVAMVTLLLIIISVMLLETGTMFVYIIALFAAYQFLLFPFVQLLVDLTSEICYPTPSSIAYVISMAVSRSYSLLLVYLIVNATLLPFVLMALVIVFCLLLAFYSKVRRNRSAVETEMAADLAVDKV